MLSSSRRGLRKRGIAGESASARARGPRDAAERCASSSVAGRAPSVVPWESRPAAVRSLPVGILVCYLVRELHLAAAVFLSPLQIALPPDVAVGFFLHPVLRRLATLVNYIFRLALQQLVEAAMSLLVSEVVQVALAAYTQLVQESLPRQLAELPFLHRAWALCPALG